MIRLKHVTVEIGKRKILEDISFTLHKGRIVMLLGENGAGKTTLIKSMVRYYPLVQGQILYRGKDCAKLKEKQHAALFSYVPQIKELMEDMRVEDCIVAGCSRNLSLFAMPKKKDYERVEACMKRLQIEHLKGRYLHEISGGELQLVYLAKALIQDAFVLLMDEPCTYLDIHKQRLFMDKIKQLKATDKSMLISMHDPRLALAYADEIIVLHAGKVYAHLVKEDGNMKQRLKEVYQALYGTSFALVAKEE